MKFNFKQLKDAISHMGYDVTSAGVDAVVDVEMISEDPGRGIMVDCIKVSITYIKPSTNYSKQTEVTTVLEIYADNAKLKPRYSETKHCEI